MLHWLTNFYSLLKRKNSVNTSFFKHFQFYGVGLGGMIPVLCFFVLAFLFGIEDLYISKSGVKWIVIFYCLVIFSTFFLNFIETNSNFFKILFTTQAILCFILIFVLVNHTGGARNSVFSFTCLYVPSVVGYVFGKKGINFIGATIVAFIIYSYNLAYPTIASSISEDEKFNLCKSAVGLDGPIKMEWFFGGIFLLQLIVVGIFASQKEELKSSMAVPQNNPTIETTPQQNEQV